MAYDYDCVGGYFEVIKRLINYQVGEHGVMSGTDQNPTVTLYGKEVLKAEFEERSEFPLFTGINGYECPTIEQQKLARYRYLESLCCRNKFKIPSEANGIVYGYESFHKVNTYMLGNVSERIAFSNEEYSLDIYVDWNKHRIISCDKDGVVKSRSIYAMIADKDARKSEKIALRRAYAWRYAMYPFSNEVTNEVQGA